MVRVSRELMVGDRMTNVRLLKADKRFTKHFARIVNGDKNRGEISS